VEEGKTNLFIKSSAIRSAQIVFLVLVVFAGTTHGAPLRPADFPSLVSALKVAEPLDFCSEKVPLGIREVRERLEKELLLTLWNRPQVILWLKRSRRYLPPVEEMLREAGLPDDLKFLAVAESALRPHAGSKRGAMGFWQFMVDTGRKYGLVINERMDERRNIIASTRAATQYLAELRKTFGSWTLAAAGFNMGEKGLMAEILEQRTQDYYQLYLPLETQRFLFRVLSVKLIFGDPETYGFRLNDKDFYPPLSYDRVRIDCFEDIPIRIIAQAAGTHFKVIKDLNPEIRGHYLGAGSHRILIPKGASSTFQKTYRGLVDEYLASRRERVYVVKKGDSLSEIADRFHIPLAALIIWNRLDLDRPIQPGDRLIIYPKEMNDDEKEGAETGS
jgi:membrane-bound lytic murein transglycosylase D